MKMQSSLKVHPSALIASALIGVYRVITVHHRMMTINCHPQVYSLRRSSLRRFSLRRFSLWQFSLSILFQAIIALSPQVSSIAFGIFHLAVIFSPWSLEVSRVVWNLERFN